MLKYCCAGAKHLMEACPPSDKIAALPNVGDAAVTLAAMMQLIGVASLDAHDALVCKMPLAAELKRYRNDVHDAADRLGRRSALRRRARADAHDAADGGPEVAALG
ncbi:hypothetical protein AK812_SmicGene5331 [Symbiodinium microadriaticum]|uniref:Uncharacterized protein n=1 Tax=Symbiodinium microadriaticum TaxID=2951 RepID=A0A1Q9EU35_SYMMI|nr:hypothetical protein AK812_SmicGene5331 [Symbiodinium microadriaticum]